MGWVWRNDDDSDYNSSWASDLGVFRASSNPYANGNGGSCATRKVVSSQCRTEEVEPGKFIRKCEKTEQIFKDCVGRPSEMVQSNQEFTEEDVTDQMTKGGTFHIEPEEHGLNYFPGLRSDIEAIERSLFGGFDRFFQAAEEMKNDFFKSVRGPEVPPSRNSREINIESHPPKDVYEGEVDPSRLARDI